MTYRFGELKQMLLCVETIWRRYKVLPDIQMGPRGGYFLLDGGQDNVGRLAKALNGKPASAPGSMQPLSVEDLLRRIELMPWREPRPFSDLLLHFWGSAREWESVQARLFEMEYGSREPVELQMLTFEGQQNILVRIKNLHVYGLLAEWLDMPDRFHVYYALDSFAEGHGIGIRWGYEVPALGVLGAYAQMQKRLYLREPDRILSIENLDFYPLLHFLNLDLGEPAEIASQRGKKTNKLFEIEVQFRAAVQTTEDDERTLEARIQGLKYQLDQIRLNRERETAVWCSLYAYDEEGLQLRSLQRFLVEQPLHHLEDFDYARIGLKLHGEAHTFHLLITRDEEPNSPPRVIPPHADFTFYREHSWYESMEFPVYLPFDLDHPFELFPPVFHAEHSREALNALFDDAVQHDAGELAALILWQEDNRILRVPIFRDHTIPLRCNFPHHINAQHIETRWPDRLFEEDPARRVRENMEELLESISAEMNALADKADRTFEEAWARKTAELQQLFEDAEDAIRQEAEVERLSKETHRLIKESLSIRDARFGEWRDFVDKVNLMEQNITQEHGKAAQRPLEDVRDRIEKVHRQDSERITSLLESIRDRIAQKDTEHRSQIVRDLRSLADWIETAPEEEL